MHFYNHYRNQTRLNGLSPLEFRAQTALYYFHYLLDREQFTIHFLHSLFSFYG
ncbi:MULTISPECIES: IS3 family transposase [Lysinibacillus]|uniref:IS3 family transposase n=1 Tax=Lysinibacillus TaxID=400634 RepID=UPI0035E44F0C